MTKMKRTALAALALASAFAAQPAAAGPLIIATKIAQTCKIQPDGSAANLQITLNSTTAAFYSTLFYHFTPASGSTVSLPGPGGNPFFLTVPAGSYQLWITTSANPNDPGASGGGPYTVTTLTPQVMNFRGRKMCIAAKQIDAIRKDALKQM